MEEINLDIDNSLNSVDFNVKSMQGVSTPPVNVSLQGGNTTTASISPIMGGDDLGIDLLVNKSKMNNEKKVPQISLVDNTPTSLNMEQPIDLDKLLEDDSSKTTNNLFSLTKTDTTNNNLSMDGPPSGSLFNDNIQDTVTPNNGPTINNYYAAPQKSPEEIHKEKVNYLRLFDSLERKGVRLEKRYTIESDLTEMKSEYERIKQRRDLDKSVRFQRKMLIAFVTGIEFLNTRFDPFDLKLDGWSESVHENAGDYDDIFEELHEKYKDKAQMAPEIKLLLMLGGSGFMFHLTNTMFKSSLPGMGDILKQNPDLMQQFTKAAVNSMGVQEPGFANLMGDVLNVNGQQTAPQGQRPPQNQNVQRQRKEMNGPPDINDILTDISTNENRKNGVSVDLGSGLSDSEIENIRNIDTSNGKRSMTLDL